MRNATLSSRSYETTATVNSLFKNNVKDPLILIELLSCQYHRYKNNCIHVTSPYIMEDKTYFEHVSYGEEVIDSVVRREIVTDTNQNFHYKEIKCDSIKDRFVYITTELLEVEKLFPNVEVLRSDTQSDFYEKDYTSSGIIMIGMLTKLDVGFMENRYIFNDTSHEILKGCKPNIINKKGQHFGSEGYFYSFGNKGAYKRNCNGSTVGQYKTKRSHIKNRRIVIENNAKDMERKCSEEVHLAVLCLQKQIPVLQKLISPIIDVLFKLQQTNGDINLKECMTSVDGLWQSQICVNAKTSEFHTEKDVTYTLISVPQQCETRRKDTFFYFS